MAYDGFCINRIAKEYDLMLASGRISKIIMPNKFDIILVIKREKYSYNLFASANPSMAYTYLAKDKTEAPKDVLNFCMVLRKYISNGKIFKIRQKGNERILTFYIEHMNEMGDKSVKKLIFEMMGKHSNIILTEEDGTIIDSIKRVTSLTSSVREVLPQKQYYFPDSLTKINPYSQDFSLAEKLRMANNESFAVSKFMTDSFEGVSKLFAKEVLYRAHVEDIAVSDLNDDMIMNISDSFLSLMDECDSSPFVYLYYKDGNPFEYSTTLYHSLSDYENHESDELSSLLYDFYNKRHAQNDILQKSADISRVLNQILLKDKKKVDEWDKELKECEDKDNLKINGELLKAYAYELKPSKKVKVLNYYTNKEIEIELDEDLSIIENSNKYFSEYSKAKRREAKLLELRDETKKEIDYIEETLVFLSICESRADIEDIRDELSLRQMLKRSSKKMKSEKSKPKHYLYKENYHIYVGKNNFQNEYLSFKVATGNDWWFHAKGVPGSHVIVKSDKDNPATEWDMPNDVFEVAGALAAINSKNSSLAKTEIDYTRKKHLKKPAEGNTGMVIYHTYYSLVANSDISAFDLTMLRN